jgi:hypothetical protein
VPAPPERIRGISVGPFIRAAVENWENCEKEALLYLQREV